jgi:hypothetical protein
MIRINTRENAWKMEAERVRQAQQQEVDDAAGEQGMDDHEP